MRHNGISTPYWTISLRLSSSNGRFYLLQWILNAAGRSHRGSTVAEQVRLMLSFSDQTLLEAWRRDGIHFGGSEIQIDALVLANLSGVALNISS